MDVQVRKMCKLGVGFFLNDPTRKNSMDIQKLFKNINLRKYKNSEGQEMMSTFPNATHLLGHYPHTLKCVRNVISNNVTTNQ